MKFTKNVEVEVTIDIPWKFARYGKGLYFSSIKENQIVTLTDSALYLDSSPVECLLRNAQECSQEEFVAALDALISKFQFLRDAEGGNYEED